MIGGALAPFTIVFLMPHMVTIAGARRESEAIVNSNHMAQYNPQAIREVQRIPKNQSRDSGKGMTVTDLPCSVRTMTLARRAALLLVGLLLLCFAFGAQAQNASPSPTASPSPHADSGTDCCALA